MWLFLRPKLHILTKPKVELVFLCYDLAVALICCFGRRFDYIFEIRELRSEKENEPVLKNFEQFSGILKELACLSKKVLKIVICLCHAELPFLIVHTYLNHNLSLKCKLTMNC
jgi:hypothetical protein